MTNSPTPPKKHKLVGYKNFKRHNPLSDRFAMHGFHHVEFWCGDATTTASRFAVGLGMQLIAKSDLSTGNTKYASYVLNSNDLTFVFSAPSYRPLGDDDDDGSLSSPFPKHDPSEMKTFCDKHGLGVRAVGVTVDDATDAYEKSIANGGRGALPPTDLGDGVQIAEVSLYGDVVLRYVSGTSTATEKSEKQFTWMPRYANARPNDREFKPLSYGLRRLDHAVGNVHDLLETVDYICGVTGMHQFAEFTAEDVGTIDSGLNSMVLANNNEFVLLPVNEPTFGTKRKSQIQTYLEQNDGPGLQHLALKTNDIFSTVREMRRHGCGKGGFEFQAPASSEYYAKLKKRVGEDALSPEQFAQVEELGLLVDRDDQGVLVQIFTKPLGDRPTVFIEIIQRVGCMREEKKEGNEKPEMEQAAGCGGFGKGNFSELFRSIEQYEQTLKV
ncbi:4-hydroxyphenylpyruvate dioxygenase [bacterium]|nr:4-hydroxyphenylpyruvate dioxygenase [bacterium]|tara:strand:+ start:9213 stop:10535 length:1323 start_codon:yes stop_codon:yes gene_type:complete